MGAWGIKALERDEGLDVLDILKNEYVPEHPVMDLGEMIELMKEEVMLGSDFSQIDFLFDNTAMALAELYFQWKDNGKLDYDHEEAIWDTAKHLNIAYGYLCDIEQSRRPAPNGDFVERISAFLNLDKSEHELLLDLAAKSRNTVSADLPDYIMEKDIVRAALRVAKEVDATDEEWQTFMKMLKERKR